MAKNIARPYITLVGNIGAGKTTAYSILQETHQWPTIDADQLFQTENPFRDLFLQDMPRWAFTNEVWMALHRSMLLKQEVASLPQKQTPVLIDCGIIISWVYTYSHYAVGTINEVEWQLFDKLYADFISPFLNTTKVILLQYSVPTLMARIKKRGRDYELESYDEAYLTQLQKGIEALVEKLHAWSIPVLILSESEIADFENNERDRQTLLAKVQQFVEESEHHD